MKTITEEIIYKMSIIGTITMLKSKLAAQHEVEVNKLLKMPYSELEQIRDGLVIQYNENLKNIKQ